MDEILVLAKYLTLQVGLLDSKYGISYTFVTTHGIEASRDTENLKKTAFLLEQEMANYIKGEKHVSKS